MKPIMSVVLVLAAVAVASIAVAEPLIVLGNARAPIVQGRQLEARGRALSAALHNALDKAVARLQGVDSGDLTDEQIEQIEAALGPSIADFIDEKQVTQDQPGTDEYRIQVRVVFNRDRLNAAMLKTGLGKRASDHFWERVMIVVTEDHRYAQSSAQTELTRNFVEQGYRAVDQQQLDTIRELDQSAALARGDVAAAVAIGRKFSAEIVVFGDAHAEALPRTNAGPAQRASLNVQMLRTDTGEILATNEMVRSGIDQTPELAARKAFATAAEAVSQYLLDQLDRRAALEQKKPRTVETVVSGISYARYVQMKKAIDAGIGGVSRYHARDFQEQALRAEVDIEFAGAAEDLADALARHRFEDFRLTITKVTPSRIDLRVVPR